jgi:hypothetical protein
MVRVHPVVFLVDVDNTLLDNDGVQQDLKDHLERTYGRDAHDRYWGIQEDLFSELGYRDYLGALQRFRAEHPLEVELLSMSSYLIDYTFAGRLFPSAMRHIASAFCAFRRGRSRERSSRNRAGSLFLSQR